MAVYKTLGQAVVGTTRTFFAVSNKQVTASVATVTTTASHSFAQGDIVSIAGVDTTFDGTWVVASAPSGTTFTFMPTVNSSVASTAVTPNATVYRTHNLGPSVASASKFSTGANAIITTGAAHGFTVNDYVRVNVGDANVDGLVKVISAPSTTTFSYAKTGSSVATTAITTGAVGRAIPSTWTQLYTPSTGTNAVISSIDVANGTGVAAQYRIAISATTTPTLAETIVFDATVAANDTVSLVLGLVMTSGKYLMVNANSPEITFSAFGSEN